MTTKRRLVGLVAFVISLCGLLLPVRIRANEPQSSPGANWTIANGEFKAPPDFRSNRFGVNKDSTRGRSLRLGEVTVLTIESRQIRLGFTLRSVPPPTFKNPGLEYFALNARGGPLVTMDVSAKVSDRR